MAMFNSYVKFPDSSLSPRAWAKLPTWPFFAFPKPRSRRQPHTSPGTILGFPVKSKICGSSHPYLFNQKWNHWIRKYDYINLNQIQQNQTNYKPTFALELTWTSQRKHDENRLSDASNIPTSERLFVKPEREKRKHKGPPRIQSTGLPRQA